MSANPRKSQFSKDKKGFNVSILILQILYYLSQSEFSKIYGRIDALKRYDSRYLHNETTQRSFLLLKMLFVMEKAQFDYTKIVKKTKALFNELSNSSLRYEGNMDGMEVIPFEDLWVITLNLIENKS